MQLTTEDLYNVVVILVVAIVAARWFDRRKRAQERVRERERAEAEAVAAAEPAPIEGAVASDPPAAPDPSPTHDPDR